jgi:hypothetical protein
MRTNLVVNPMGANEAAEKSCLAKNPVVLKRTDLSMPYVLHLQSGFSRWGLLFGYARLFRTLGWREPV